MDHDYPLVWVTSSLAVGHAPMSYAELDSIRAQGIDAIVNLCGEFSDLHEIEEAAGFEVYFLPVADESAPEAVAMEKGLAWLDEAIYLGKKVLVHCRHGIGRTGTFVTAYLLRRGFSIKDAGHRLKATRATPTNFSQWWLLRRFGKKEGRLTLGQPTAENRQGDGLAPYFERYEKLCMQAAAYKPGTDASAPNVLVCRPGPDQVELIEALYLHARANVGLTSEERERIMARSANDLASTARTGCLLLEDDGCLEDGLQPLCCRLAQGHAAPEAKPRIERQLAELSREVFEAIFAESPLEPPPKVSLAEAVSGRFIQRYFHYLAAQALKKKKTDTR